MRAVDVEITIMGEYSTFSVLQNEVEEFPKSQRSHFKKSIKSHKESNFKR